MTEIIAEVRNNRVILLDLRDQDEYRAGHLPHAKHIELRDLKRRVDEHCASVLSPKGNSVSLGFTHRN
jgi:rhodanese-related sulfurtransferase